MRFHPKFIVIILISCAIACNSNDKKSSTNEFNNISKKDTVDLYSALTEQMSNKVMLDTFIDKITHQEKVKVIANLSETWDDESKMFVYSGDGYNFKLKYHNVETSDLQKSNSIFIDGKNIINFKDYYITCYHDSIFRCEDYGFNWDNTLKSPKIIEVCSKRFLYADISYNCNGIGCGCFINFIYDLQTNKPTFIENYRVPYDGFFISDLDNDNNPDILVISSSLSDRMKGFDLEDFQLRFTPFSYNNGVFKPKFDNQYQRLYCYQFYGFTPDYHHSYHDGLIYSITEDNWFRQ